MRISDWSSDVCSSDLRELQTIESGSPFASAATDVRIAAVLATGDEDRALSMAQSAAAASDADTSDFVRVAGLLAQQENYVAAADEYHKARSEERRVGEEGVREVRCRRSPYD